MTFLENFRARRFQEHEDEGDPPIFSPGARVTVRYYPVDSTLVGETGLVRAVRGRYGRRGAEASTGSMLASPGEYLYEVALDAPPPNKPKTISVRESGLGVG